MIAAAATTRAHARPSCRTSGAWAFALLCSVAAFPAWAAEGNAATFQEPLGRTADEGPRLGVMALALPRFDGTESSARSQRLDMSLLAQQPLAFGPTLGLVGGPAPGRSPGLATDTISAVTLGMHWRYSPDSNSRIDILAWRRVSPPADALALVQSHQGDYGARVEMKLGQGRRSGLVADRAFLGMQLDGGARVGLKRSAGKPMVYYRNNF